MPIKTLHIGLGPIGAGVVRQVSSRKGFKIVGAVDIDPAKIGMDLGDVCAVARVGHSDAATREKRSRWGHTRGEVPVADRCARRWAPRPPLAEAQVHSRVGRQIAGYRAGDENTVAAPDDALNPEPR